MTVFANGLEIACKAQANQVIAAFPYVCMTPPQTPATPPGVPVPYPTFGMDSDTDKGTSTVKIGDKTVTQKNLSYYTKCTGNEAGCAPMKNVISHVNTGKEYAHAWSGNVKMDGEPVSRFSDISTNDHASPQAGGPPWPKIGQMKVGRSSCKTILANVGLKVHRYGDAGKECTSGQQSDHILQNACLQNTRGGDAIDTASAYTMNDAPCVCLEDATKTTTQHGRKTLAQNEWATLQRAKPGSPNPTYEEVREANMEAMKKALELPDGPKGKEHPAIKCLRMVCDAHFKPMMSGKDKDKTQCRTPRTGDFEPTPVKTVGAK